MTRPAADRPPTPGEIIRARRKELGLTQKGLAERVGRIDAAAISNIERGAVGVGHDRAMRFARALAIDSDLLDGAGGSPRPTLQTVLDHLEEHAVSAAQDRQEVLELRDLIVAALEALETQVRVLAERLEGTGGRATKPQAR